MGEFTVNLDTVVFLVFIMEVRGEVVTDCMAVVGKEHGSKERCALKSISW